MDQNRLKTHQRCRTANTVASFLLKTLEILEHPDYQHIIGWTSDNVSFIIKNVQQFSKEVLPRYFRHSNFSSFVRQLNMYDFHKVKQDKDSIVFRNELFIRNGQALLRQIKRKAPQTKKQEYKELSRVDSKKKQHRPPSSSNQHVSCEVKRLLEAEVNYSSYLFEKTIKHLERPIHFKNPCEEFHGWMVRNEGSSDSTANNKSLINLLYEIKSKCYSLFTSYETILMEVDTGYQQKMASLETAMPNAAVAELPVEQENKLLVRQRQTVAPSLGFMPCSTISLVGKYSTMEQTKIASAPELNQ